MSTAMLHQPVPLFSAPMTNESTFSLESYRGRYVVLFFYPKDSTPGCTLESQAFSRLQEGFSALNTVVFGLSRDSLKSHTKFQNNCGVSVPLISDADEAICTLFGVMKDKTMFGKPVRGIARSTFVIDPNGVLLKEWRSVKAEGHAEAVLDWMKGSVVVATS